MDNMQTLFMGQPIEYWVELQRRANEDGLKTDLLREILALRGKLSFYEDRIREMHKVILNE